MFLDWCSAQAAVTILRAHFQNWASNSKGRKMGRKSLWCTAEPPTSLDLMPAPAALDGIMHPGLYFKPGKIMHNMHPALFQTWQNFSSSLAAPLAAFNPAIKHMHILPPDVFNVVVLFPPNGGCLPTRSHIKRLEHWKTLPLLPKTSRELESESLLQVYFAIFEYRILMFVILRLFWNEKVSEWCLRKIMIDYVATQEIWQNRFIRTFFLSLWVAFRVTMYGFSK